MSRKVNGIILTAAKADITICEVFGDIPTGLIPVNGKPVIFFILQQMIDNGTEEVYIGVDYKSQQVIEIVDLYFKAKINIIYIYTDKNKLPGNSLLKVFNKIKYGNVVVNLGDTYIKDIIYDDLKNSLVVSKDFIDEERWATVQVKDDKSIRFLDKKRVASDNIYAISGLYSFKNIEIFNDFNSKNKFISINDLLKYYNDFYKIGIIETNKWLDFGHIDKYYISKKRLIQSRDFNSLAYDDLLGTITKRSKNKEKFIAEVNWQLNLPKEMKILAPRVLDYNLDDNPFITMEFYSYPTLAEIWLFSDFNEKIYFSIIDKLFKILKLFSKSKQQVLKEDYVAIYKDKTTQRINDINNKKIIEFLKDDNIIINGKSYKNWNQIKQQVFKNTDNLFTQKDNCLIHGDFCLSNILYDLRSGIVRLIDARGEWGSSQNGDIKYDIAKLRHSICGNYDYIVNDLFNVEFENNTIDYTIFYSDKDSVTEYFDKKLSQYYDINQIKLIEGLLFISMIALHSDSENRQLVMFAKAIELLNDSILKGNK